MWNDCIGGAYSHWAHEGRRYCGGKPNQRACPPHYVQNLCCGHARSFAEHFLAATQEKSWWTSWFSFMHLPRISDACRLRTRYFCESFARDYYFGHCSRKAAERTKKKESHGSGKATARTKKKEGNQSSVSGYQDDASTVTLEICFNLN